MNNFRFKTKYTLDAHQQVHTGKKFQCALCGKRYSRKAPLEVHLQIHNGTFTRKYHCDLCDRTFKTSGHMRNHRRTHTGEKPYKCDPCNYATGYQSELARHLKRICHLNKLKESLELQK